MRQRNVASCRRRVATCRIALAFLLAATAAAAAHSWYPAECCHGLEDGGDCRPVPCDELLEGKDGGLDYHAPEGFTVYVAPSKVQPSPNKQCHICYGASGIGYCAWLHYGT
jgi:hypothetical protein